VTGTNFYVHTKNPFRKRAASDRRLHDSVYFFSRRLLVLKNNQIELHSHIALACKRLQTVKIVFLSNSSLSSSTSHSILARESRNRSMTSQSAISARKGRLDKTVKQKSPPPAAILFGFATFVTFR